jgi:hypothetical protein
MLTKLICLLFGHRFVVKAYTGETKRVLNAFRGYEDAQYYTYENKKFCIRCGANNPAYKKDKDVVDPLTWIRREGFPFEEGTTSDSVKAQGSSSSPDKKPDGPRERLVGKRMKQGCEDLTRADVRM